MSLNTVCRICLAMDVPMYSIVDTPLQNIYEKLSTTPLNMCHRPAVACYICCAQLKKSHNLMVRSVRADRVFAQILLTDDIVKEESITLLNQEAYRHALHITPVDLISITGNEHINEHVIKTEIKEEPLLSQYDEGIETDRPASAQCLTFEQSEEEAMEEVLLEDEHIESQILIDEGDIKQEEEDPLDIFIPLKCIDTKVTTAGDMRLEREDMTRKQSEGAVMKTSCYVCRGTSHIASDCPKRYKKKNVVTASSKQLNLCSKAAGTLETSGAAPAERCKETHADNVQDASTLTPDGQKIPEKPGIRTTDVEEATSRNMDRYVLQSTKKAINKNSRADSDTANKGDICVVSDNVCPSTNTGVGDATSERARRKFVCENCGTVFDDKCLLLEHIVHHVTVKKKSCRNSSRGAANEHEQTLSRKNLYKCEVCKVRFSQKSDLKLHLIRTEKALECQIYKRRFNDNGSLKIHSRIHTGEKPYKCDICKFRFNNKSSLTKHLRIHTGEKPYECEICKGTVEFITTKHRKIQDTNELIVTPLELIVIAGPEHSPIDANIKRAPLSPQCKEEVNAEGRRSIDSVTLEESVEEDFNRVAQRDVGSIENGGSTDREHITKQLVTLTPQCKEEIDTGKQRCIDYVTFEESVDEDFGRVVQSDVGSINNGGSTDREQITDQLGNAADIERDGLTGAGNIKQEKPEEMQTYVRRCIGYLKFEDSDGEHDIDRNETTVETNTKHEQPLSSQRQELTETGRRRLIDYLKFEDSEHEEDFERVIPMDVENIENKRTPGGRDIEDEEIQEPVDTNSTDTAAAAPAERCQETYAENIQGSTLTPGGKDIPGEPRAIVEEASRNIGRYVLQSTKKANDRHVSRTSSTYADIAINEKDTSSDNDRTSTNTDVDINLRRMFVCDDCGNIFDDKYLLIEHIERHITVKRTNYRNSLPRRKRIFSRIGVLNKHTETYSRKKLVECEICHRRFTRKWNLKIHLQTHTGIKPFECEICKVRFTANSSLKTHLRVHTKEKPYECEICKVRFSRKDNLKIHLTVHTKEKPYEYEICKVRFTQKGSLKTHLRVHTKEKPYECEICKVRFTQKGSLKTHLRVHTKEKPYECEICKVRFTQKGSLKSHLRVHTKDKPYECEICKVRFTTNSSLKTHLRVHTKEKPYECEICKVRFTANSNLKTHLRVHTKDKPYECEICKVRFTANSSLKTHLRVHTKEKPYECEICKIRFNQKCHLKTHFRVHTKEKPYECEICKVRFSQKGNLKIHLTVHTKEKPYECEICKIRFNQKGHLSGHLRIHTKEKPYECEICKVRFTRKGSLKTHLRVHTKEKPYECKICKVKFSRKDNLKIHLTVHTKEKPYECEICKVRFSEKCSLNRHLRVNTKENPARFELENRSEGL